MESAPSSLHASVALCVNGANQQVRLNSRDHCRSRNEILLCQLQQPVSIRLADGRQLQLQPGEGAAACFLVSKRFKHNNNNTPAERRRNLEIARNEFNQLTSNAHPHIVQAFELHEPQAEWDLPELFMECGDLSVAQVLYPARGSSPFASLLRQRVAWALQAASALQFLHSARVIHRDIKSHNMLLFQRGTLLKLCDLEFSREQDVTMTTGRGTRHWMAPEMVLVTDDKGSYDAKVDCWSFGMAVYELLFARLPFDGLGDIYHILSLSQETPNSPIRVARQEADNARSILIDWSQASACESVPQSVQNAVHQLLLFDPRHRSSIAVAADRLSEEFSAEAEELQHLALAVADGSEFSPGIPPADLLPGGGVVMVTAPNRIEVTVSGDSVTRQTSQ